MPLDITTLGDTTRKTGRARRHLMLGAATAAVGMIGYGRGAHAYCAFAGSSGGVVSFVCDDPSGAQFLNDENSITATTTGDFSVSAPGSTGITIRSSGTATFDDGTNASEITAGGGDGIYALGKYGGVSITTSGDVTGSGDGIEARTRDGDISVSISGTVRGGADGAGIYTDAKHFSPKYGSGGTDSRTTITVTGEGTLVTGGKYGIKAESKYAGAPYVTAGADITVEDGATVAKYSGGGGKYGPGAAISVIGGRNTVTVENGGTVEGSIIEGIRIAGGPGGYDPGKYGTQTDITVSGDVRDAVIITGGGDSVEVTETGRVGAGIANFFASDETSLLSGTGTVGDVYSGAALIVSPGGSGGSEIGTLTVEGDLVLEEKYGGKYTPNTVDIQVAADGTSDRIDVGGRAYIQGATLRVSSDDPLEDFPATGEYVVIDAADGVEGEFSEVVDDIPDLGLLVSYTGTEVILSYELDIENLTDKAGIGATAFAAGQAGRLFSTVLQMHAMPGVVPFEMGQETTVSSAGMVDLPAPLAAAARDVSVFANLLGGRTDVDGDGDATGYDADSAGVMLGVRSGMAAGAGDLQFGAAIGYVETDVDAGVTDGEVEGVHLGLFAGYDAGPLSVGGTLTYGDLDMETVRDLGVFEGEGSMDGRTASAQVEVSYDVASRFGMVGSHIAPFLGAEIVHASWDGFEEDGSTLAVDGGDATTRFLRTGIRYHGTIAGGALRPSLSVGFERAFGDLAATTVSNVGIGGDLLDTSAEIDRDRFTLGAGLGFGSGPVRGHVGYRGVFGEDSDEQSAMVGVSMRF